MDHNEVQKWKGQSKVKYVIIILIPERTEKMESGTRDSGNSLILYPFPIFSDINWPFFSSDQKREELVFPLDL